MKWLLAALAAVFALAWLRGRSAMAAAPPPSPSPMPFAAAVASGAIYAGGGVVTSSVVGVAPKTPFAVVPAPTTVPTKVSAWAPSLSEQIAKAFGNTSSPGSPASTSKGAPSSPFAPTPSVRISGSKVGSL